MGKIDAIFLAILLWCIVSTALLVRQTQSNTELQRQLTANIQLEKVKVAKETRKAKRESLGAKYRDDENLMGRVPKDKNKVHSKVAMTSDQFPFTRSLEQFGRSANFFIYVVQSTSPPASGSGGGGSGLSISTSSSPLEWSEVRWKDLVLNWERNTTYENLLQMSTSLADNEGETGSALSAAGAIPKKIVLHCLPKAASTTLRRACYEHMKRKCDAIKFRTQHDPFGYRKVDDFFRAVKECDNIDHFCVQGGDMGMNIINYDNTTNGYRERDPVHFVHMVPFRNYDEWVESAIKQIYFIDGEPCGRVDKLLDQCLGYRELYMELYPKIALSLLTGMTFDANSKGLLTKDTHHIVLYNYKDVDTIVTEVSEFFGLNPLPRTNVRHKGNIDAGTCPSGISDKFHQCHDDTLINTDAIRGLEAEHKRRRKNDATMKHLLNCVEKGTCERCMKAGRCKKDEA